jgi:hypothetical protein
MTPVRSSPEWNNPAFRLGVTGSSILTRVETGLSSCPKKMTRPGEHRARRVNWFDRAKSKELYGLAAKRPMRSGLETRRHPAASLAAA